MWPLWSIIFEWFLTAFILLGNGMAIYLIATRRKLRTTTNCIVLSLAIADFGVGATFASPYIFCRICDNCNPRAKAIAIFTGESFLCASLSNLSVLTLERYKAIVMPLQYVTYMTRKRVTLLLLIAWVVPGAVLLSFVATYLSRTSETYDVIKRSYWKFLAVLAFFVCGLLLFATARLFLVVRRITRHNAAVITQLGFNHRIPHSVAFRARETASAKMVAIVVAAFVTCYSLHIGDTVLRLFLSSTDNTLNIIFTLLALMNSGVNPVAYALLKREFRKELRRTIRRTKQALTPRWLDEARQSAHHIIVAATGS